MKGGFQDFVNEDRFLVTMFITGQMELYHLWYVHVRDMLVKICESAS